MLCKKNNKHVGLLVLPLNNNLPYKNNYCSAGEKIHDRTLNCIGM